MTIRSTYALDPLTVHSLEELARTWHVSKSEALRRSIAQAKQASILKSAFSLEDSAAALNQKWLEENGVDPSKVYALQEEIKATRVLEENPVDAAVAETFLKEVDDWRGHDQSSSLRALDWLQKNGLSQSEAQQLRKEIQAERRASSEKR